jgi:hypothetical protein
LVFLSKWSAIKDDWLLGLFGFVLIGPDGGFSLYVFILYGFVFIFSIGFELGLFFGPLDGGFCV